MIAALIVAAGRSTRMGGVDKLFLSVAGLPVVGHTWRRFDQLPEIGLVILVIRPESEMQFRELAVRIGARKPFHIVVGGEERQDSVWNGIERLPDEVSLVAIQDAARPCACDSLIADTIEQARKSGAAVAAQKMIDTVKESRADGTVAKTLDRSHLWAVQTPQVFQKQVIRAALMEARQRGLKLTDDTAACELIGAPVTLVSSVAPNPKVTSPSDLPYVELLLSQMENQSKQPSLAN